MNEDKITQLQLGSRVNNECGEREHHTGQSGGVSDKLKNVRQ
jgi:hypothetical protein